MVRQKAALLGVGGGEPMTCVVQRGNPLVIKNETRAKTLRSELIGIDSTSAVLAHPRSAHVTSRQQIEYILFYFCVFVRIG